MKLEKKQFEKIDFTFKRIKLFNNNEENKSKEGSFFIYQNLNSNASTYDSFQGFDKKYSWDNYDNLKDENEFLKKKKHHHKYTIKIPNINCMKNEKKNKII